MTLRVFTTHEKLSEIERLIEEDRQSGYRNEILKAVASDLRARLAGAPSVAMTQLERRLVAAKRTTFGLGRSRERDAAIMGVGEETLARWPIIKQALERFGARIESKIGA